MEDLQTLRGQLDEIDRQLVPLLEGRMDLVRRVGDYKRAHGLPVLDADRERDLLAEKRAMLRSPQNAPAVTALFETLMAVSRQSQRQSPPPPPFPPVRPPVSQPRVLYQGEPGAYAEEAAARFFGEDSLRENYPTWEDLFRALDCRRGDYAVLPVENSSSGILGGVYDLLSQYGGYLVGEVLLPVSHCLMALPGAALADIRTVYSHEQGLLQSRVFLQAHPDWVQIPRLNTAESAKFVAETGDPTCAAIGSARAAALYGLNILQQPVSFNSCNATRFVVVSLQPELRPGSDKISVLLTLPHESGSLYRLMQVFALHGLSLLKLESRPIVGRNWEYRFFVDFSGCLTDDGMDGVLAELGEVCGELRILGNYPREVSP
ncbi:MAG: prephenate dehydratase domain-containing protein [Oscillospiraceae bacterium]